MKILVSVLACAALLVSGVAAAHGPHHGHGHRRSSDRDKIIWAIGGAVVAGAIINERNRRVEYREETYCRDVVAYDYYGHPYVRTVCRTEYVPVEVLR